MELVRGMPITRYCDENQLPLQERLNLFIQVCNAIQHAHRKGILHRDIKPSNVLVAVQENVPIVKVIDFGLAMALQSAEKLTDKSLSSELGKLVGTLQYMSPEQAGLNAVDVDTRCDVYSLGVLFFELLTGTTPIEPARLKEWALDQVLTAIRTEDAPRPSQRLSSNRYTIGTIAAGRRFSPGKVLAAMKGDLDWIALKALDKDRTRRYDSPQRMAEDIQRFLNHEPVLARAPSWDYRLGKLSRKHKGKFAAGVTLLLLFAGGLVGYLQYLQQRVRAENAESHLAQQEARDARKTAEEAVTDASRQRALARQAQENEKKEKELRSEADDAKKLALNKANEAVEANSRTRMALARSNFFLAVARFRENRAGEAMDVLFQIPPEHRRLEWYLARRLFEGSDLTLYGHQGDVGCVAFGPDGTRIATGSSDQTIRLWDSTTGEEL